MIPTYNCGAFLAEALRSVLQQDPGPAEMQIEVVDDCSSADDPLSVVRGLAGSRVAFFRQARNVGATSNFNRCLQRAHGLYVHILHGDDAVAPGFYECLGAALLDAAQAGAAFCRSAVIDEAGRNRALHPLESDGGGPLVGFIERLALGNRIMMSSMVVRRSVYEELGGFRTELIHAADWEMWVRIAARHPIWYEPRPLARYRGHAGSDTARLKRTGANIADARKAISLMRDLLPAPSAAELSRTALERHARFALHTARHRLGIGEWEGTLAQVEQALECAATPAILRSALQVVSAEWHGTGAAPSPREPARLAVLRQIRARAAEAWMGLSGKDLEEQYLGDLGHVQERLLEGGLREVEATGPERALAAGLLNRASSGLPADHRLRQSLAAQLYLHGEDTRGTAAPTTLPATPRGTPPERATWSPAALVARRRLEARRRASMSTGRPAGMVAFAVDSGPAGTGRGGPYVRGWAKGLQERGLIPFILTPRAPGGPFAGDGVPVLSNLRLLEQCDAVVSHGASPWVLAVGRRLCDLARSGGGPAWLHCPGGSGGPGLWMLERADRILALSSWDAELATLVGGRSTQVLHLAPAIPEPLPDPGEDFRTRARIEGDYLVWADDGATPQAARKLCERFLLFCNRHPSNAITLVLLAASLDVPPIAHPDIRVWPLDDRSWAAAVPGALFVACDSTLHSPERGGPPPTLLQALRQGKTFIAYDRRPVPRELARLGLVVKGDAEWLQAMETLVFDPGRRGVLEGAATQASRETYDLERVLSTLAGVLQQLAASRSARATAAPRSLRSRHPLAGRRRRSRRRWR